MSSSKLAIADKQEILRLYCETDLSMAKLSKQFGISPSTILRLLQEMIAPEAYKEIVQKKQTKSPKSKQEIKPQRQPIASESAAQIAKPLGSQLNLELLAVPEETESPKTVVEFLEDFDEQKRVVEDLVHELVHEDIIDDEFDEDDELDPEDEEFDEDQGSVLTNPNLNSVAILSILPLEEAEMSHICYIVVDKASEIVTRPMRDFKDLGKVPTHEINLQALPVFDNHRSARRFSTPNQKVIKFPSSLIYATRSHLSQKGITRLLYDGQVFSI